jgi:osmotically-inducible protein OsmY
MNQTETPNNTDLSIQRDVQDELAWDGHVRPGEIGVAVNDGIVTLTGTVESYLARVAAQDAAHRVRGVRAVANEIEVQVPAFESRTDEDLARAAVEALLWDAAIPNDTIDVSVSDGWVTLTGEADWPVQRDSAERAVHRLSGLRGVSNQITVKSHPVLSDVRKQIERALMRSAEVDANRIQIEVAGTVAILKGTVRSYIEKRAAEHSALLAPGITAVENDIEIDPWL